MNRFSGYGNRRGRRSFRTSMQSYRPVAHITRNRFETTLSPAAGTETPIGVVACVEAPGDRGSAVPAGAIIRSIVVQCNTVSTGIGKHQYLLVYRPASEDLATPIAAYWNSADPLSEEGVKMRRLAMSKCITKQISTASIVPFTKIIKWKGQKRLYDGDDISLWVLDSATSTYDCEVWITFTQ